MLSPKQTIRLAKVANCQWHLTSTQYSKMKTYFCTECCMKTLHQECVQNYSKNPKTSKNYDSKEMLCQSQVKIEAKYTFQV